MQADKGDQIREEQARLTSLRQETHNLEQVAADLQSRLNTARAREQDNVRENKRLKLAFQQAADALGRLEDELSKATPDAAAIEVLEESLAVAVREVADAEGLYEDMIVQKSALNTENRENKRKLEAAQTKLEELEFKLNKAKATVIKYDNQRADDLKRKNKAILQVEAAEENKKIWLEEQASGQVELDTAIKAAEEVCPQRVDVPDGKKATELGNMLEQLRNTRKMAEKELGGSQDQLLREANEAKRVHQEARKEFDSLEGLKTVCEVVCHGFGRLANYTTAPYQYSQQPPTTVATVPLRHLRSSPCHIQLSSQRAQISWHP